eukprot:GHVR01012051.1.p1 GENE.GHVR01012051.1~~GHVR01012051.1.p1  ORF type:complete len:274 (-),score=66.14 GHVR01012051.1:591-1412(-)
MSEKTLKRKHSDTKEQHIASVLKDYTPENGSELAIRWFVEDDADDEGDIVSRWSVWWPCTLRSLPLEGVTEGCSGSPELVESPHWANTSVSVVEKSEELSIEELYSEELKSRQTSSERTTVVDGREVTIRGDTVWLACFKSITTPLGEFSRSSHRVYFTHITQTTTVGPPTPSAAETVCASRSVSMSAPPTLPHEETQPTKVICSASPEKSCVQCVCVCLCVRVCMCESLYVNVYVCQHKICGGPPGKFSQGWFSVGAFSVEVGARVRESPSV